MGPFGVPELIIILVIVVIIFGVGKLPEIGGAFGKSIKEFKTQADDGDEHPPTIDAGTSEKASSLTTGSSTSQDAGIGNQAIRREVRADEV